MKTLISVSLATMLLCAGSIPSFAANTNPNGAIVDRITGGCSNADANQVIAGDPTSRAQIVVNNNQMNITCKSVLQPGQTPPTKAIRYDNSTGPFCGCLCLPGEKWWMTVSPSGEVSNICKIPLQ
jgi:hypothetical protein